MKKIITIISVLLFAILYSVDVVSAATTTTAQFTFEDAAKRAIITNHASFVSNPYTADNGIADNINTAFIGLGGGNAFSAWVQGSGGAGTYAPNSNSWDSGSGTKYWYISLSTVGYKDIKLSSKQRGSSTGPRDFKVQWSLDGSSWTDVAGSNITVADNWSSGVLTSLALPADVQNKSTVYLRWIMTSNTSVSGGIVGSAGTDRIDGIAIVGTLLDIGNWWFEDAAKRAITNFTTDFYTADDATVDIKDIAPIKLNGSSFTAWVQGSGGAGTYAPNANSWDSGANTKHWYVTFSTSGYEDLKLSSKQYSSATGPRDFKVQWSLDGVSWTDVAGSNITVATNWTSGVLTDIDLPSNIEDKSTVYLRWIMTSNTRVGGGAVGAAGTDRIDDIVLGGKRIRYALNYAAGANGSLTGTTTQNIYYKENGSAVTAVPDADYHFVKWSDDVTTNPRTDLSVTGSINVTAEFAFNVPYANCGDTYWYDGYGHPTGLIGTQCWFLENLKYLPSVSAPSSRSKTDPYYYVYDYSGTDVNDAKATANYSTHGVLYNYPAALTACPTGFRLATDNDIKIMEMFLGLSQAEADDLDWRGTNEGSKMKSNTLWNGTNESGFNATPSGLVGGIFNQLNNENFIWTSTQKDDDNSWARVLASYASSIRRYFYGNDLGFSVRCVLNTYTVTYDGNANTGGAVPADQTKTHGVDLALRSNTGLLVKTGYTFAGWNTAADGSGTHYAEGGNFTTDANTTLYAEWTIKLGGGGGLPPIAYTNPKSSLKAGQIIINDNDETTASQKVKITLNYSSFTPEITGYALSNDSKFTSASIDKIDDYKKNGRTWNLCSGQNNICPDGQYMVYVKFYTQWGRASEVYSDGIVLKTKETIESCQTPIYLTKPVKFGANNNPEDVKLLEKFLNTYEGYDLPVNGVYSATDRDAVIKWQEKYHDEVLKPWGLTKGTGYIYTTSLKKIKQIHEALCKNEVAQSQKNQEQVSVKYQFTRDLSTGMIGEDVRELQKYLNNNGFILVNEGLGSPGNETDKFGALTRNALIRFQQANSISPAIGYFGPITRAVVNR